MPTSFTRDGNIDQARAAVDDIVTYSEKARDAALQTKKHLKNIEIDARKIADKLRDIKRTLAFDDQPPVEQAIRRLEDVRTTLLKEMFAKENKKEKNEAGHPALAHCARLAMLLILPLVLQFGLRFRPSAAATR